MPGSSGTETVEAPTTVNQFKQVLAAPAGRILYSPFMRYGPIRGCFYLRPKFNSAGKWANTRFYNRKMRFRRDEPRVRPPVRWPMLEPNPKIHYLALRQNPQLNLQPVEKIPKKITQYHNLYNFFFTVTLLENIADAHYLFQKGINIIAVTLMKKQKFFFLTTLHQFCYIRSQNSEC